MLCSIRSSGLLKVLLHITSLADLFDQTLSQLRWEAYAPVNLQRLLVHISTAVYSQVLIYIGEWTGAM